MKLPVVITANYGGYDRIKPPPPSHSRALLLTDQPSAEGWEVQDKASSLLPPRYRAKGGKACPHLYGIEEDDVLWIDSSMQSTGKDISTLFELVPTGGVGLFRHRWRSCIEEEAAASVGMLAYQGEPIAKQASYYLEKHPKKWGLWENGIMVWRGLQKRIGPRWLAEMLAWSSQDQISFPYVAREMEALVVDLQPGNVVDNPWFSYVHHGH